MKLAEFNSCIDTYGDNLYRFAFNCTGHKEEATLVVQESIDKLWQKKDDLTEQNFRGQLFRTAYNQATNVYRSKSGMFTEQPDSGVQRQTVSTVLGKGLMHLNKRERALVLLKDYEAYSYDEIVDITGLQLEQVKSCMQRARVMFKNYLISFENSKKL